MPETEAMMWISVAIISVFTLGFICGWLLRLAFDKE